MSAHKSVEAAIGAKANATADGPLLLAAQNGGNPVVQRLAAASASVNSWDALEEMLLAAEKGGTADPRLAAAGASVNSSGAYGKTPLILAAEKGHSDVIDTLVRTGASLDEGLKPGGQTALHSKTHRHSLSVRLRILDLFPE